MRQTALIIATAGEADLFADENVRGFDKHRHLVAVSQGEVRHRLIGDPRSDNISTTSIDLHGGVDRTGVIEITIPAI